MNPGALGSEARRDIDRLPKVSGGSGAHLSPAGTQLINDAEEHARTMKDEYTSVEHLLMALSQAKTPAGELLRSHGITLDAIMPVLQEIRGTQSVNDQNPEDKYQSLKRFARDLTEAAAQASWTR